MMSPNPQIALVILPALPPGVWAARPTPASLYVVGQTPALNLGYAPRYGRVWFNEGLPVDEVVFEAGVYLLTKQRAKALKATPPALLGAPVGEPLSPEPALGPGPLPGLAGPSEPLRRRVRIIGNIPPELWNRLGTKLIPKLRAGDDLRVGIDITVDVEGASSLESDVRLILKDLELEGRVRIENQ